MSDLYAFMAPGDDWWYDARRPVIPCLSCDGDGCDVCAFDCDIPVEGPAMVAEGPEPEPFVGWQEMGLIVDE